MWKVRGYVVEQLLGRGGSGEVWRARVAATGDAVALKRLPLADAARARSEAAMLSALDHPHLVRLHALVPGEDVSVLVLDLADGGSLAELLAARGRLTPGEVITAVSPIAAALAYLHAAGVVHGDVSPANVLFTPGGIPLLADLGVARLTGDDADAESSAAYVDPAVADGCVPGPTSDVFMLGAVALHALTGTPPWPGPADEALAAAQAERIGDIGGRLRAAGVPPEMAKVVVRALALDPSRRGTAADFALELRHSGEPLAVELGAGRPRTTPSAGVDGAAGRPGSASASVWTGPRHAAASPTAPPTRSLGPRPRPSPPPPGRRRLRRPGSPPTTVPSRSSRRPPESPGRRLRHQPRPASGMRRTATRAGGLVVAAFAVLAVVAFGLRGAGSSVPPHRDGAPSVRSGSSAAPSVRSGSSAAPSVRSGSSAAPTGTPATAAATPQPVTWADRLNALDGVRARAFATRRPDLLRQVYVPGPLLAADTGLLLRLVPVGCGLVGVRTAYRSVVAVPARARGGAVEVTVVASLPASRLRCGNRFGARAAASGPTALRLRLQLAGSGWRIADQVPA